MLKKVQSSIVYESCGVKFQLGTLMSEYFIQSIRALAKLKTWLMVCSVSGWCCFNIIIFLYLKFCFVGILLQIVDATVLLLALDQKQS